MNVAETLRATANHIETVGWYRGDYFPPENYREWNGDWAMIPDSCPACVMGAMGAVLKRDPWDTAASGYLKRKLRKSVPLWNDETRGLTKEKVVARLRKVASAWEEENVPIYTSQEAMLAQHPLTPPEQKETVA